MSSTTNVDAPRRSVRSVARDFLLGAGAATGATCMSNPIDSIKTRLQLASAAPALSSAPSPGDANGPAGRLFASLRGGGLGALQVGLRPAIAYNVLLNGARLSLYRPLCREGCPAPVAGGMAGAVGALTASPAWVLKVRSHAGCPTSLSGLVRKEGARAAYRGVGVAMLRVSTASAVQLSTYDWAKSVMGSPESWATRGAAAAVAGVATIAAFNPFDVIATRLAAAGPGMKLSTCARTLVREGGWLGFYRGSLTNYLRVGPHTAVTLLLWELGKGLCDEIDQAPALFLRSDVAWPAGMLSRLG